LGGQSTLVFLVDLDDGRQVSVDEPFVGRRLQVGDCITVWGSPKNDETFRGGSIGSLLAIPVLWLVVSGSFVLVLAITGSVG
jgi:hypothetical protein